jgi:hypothetical protein
LTEESIKEHHRDKQTQARSLLVPVAKLGGLLSVTRAPLLVTGIIERVAARLLLLGIKLGLERADLLGGRLCACLCGIAGSAYGPRGASDVTGNGCRGRSLGPGGVEAPAGPREIARFGLIGFATAITHWWRTETDAFAARVL